MPLTAPLGHGTDQGIMFAREIVAMTPQSKTSNQQTRSASAPAAPSFRLILLVVVSLAIAIILPL